MSFYFPNVDAIFLFKRAGTPEDPFLPLQQDLQVKFSKVTLKEIPDFTTKVSVKNADNVNLTEITNPEPQINEYRDDYSTGIVYFNIAQEDEKLTFAYTGIGQLDVPASRMIVNTSNDNAERITVQDIIDANTEVNNVKALVEQNQVVKKNDYNVDMNNVTTQLAQTVQQVDTKMDKNTTDISVSQINKNKGKFDQTYMTDEFLQQMAGNTPINAVPADKSITENKLAVPVIIGTKGKNLFNKATVILDKYVDYTTGNLATSTDFAVSDYIEIDPTTSYYISGSSGQCAYYDVDKVYVGGKINSILNNIPSTAKYLRMSVKKVDLETAQLEVGTAPTSYEPYGNKLNNDTVSEQMLKEKSVSNGKIADESVDNRTLKKESVTLEKLAQKSVDETKLTKTFAYAQVGKNKFDKSKVTSGYYVDYSTGNLVPNADYSVSTYIEISSTNPYYVSGSTGGQCAYYDVNKVFILGKTNQILNNIPADAKYLRMSVKMSELDTAQLEIGTTPTVYEPYKHVVNPDDITRTKQFNLIKTNTLTVKPDGTGDFTNPVAAIAYINTRKDMSWHNQYNIEIHEGVYDIVSAIGQTAIDNLSTRGLEIPDFVNVIGIGSRENIILKGELPSTATNAQVTQISPLNYEKGGRLENITVTAKNMRYAVHADGNTIYKDYEGRIKNCAFIHFGNDPSFTWQTTSPWGSGIHSGSTRLFEDCIFISHKDAYPFSVHSNVDFTKSSLNILRNCTFINLAGDSAFNVNSLGSGAINKVTLIGCKLNGKIIVKRSGTAVDNYLVDGYGNQVVPHEFVDTDGSLREYIDFTDEVKYLVNNEATTITKGSIVKVDGYSGCKLFSSADSVVLFEGIALEDISTGEKGAIKFNGYVLLADIGLTANLGDKVGIVDGSLAVVTTGDYVGYVDKVGYLKLI